MIFELGMPVARFKNYPEDCRLKLYRNLEGESRREGMFLFGYLEYEEGGEMKRVKNPGQSYDLYIRDQVGLFRGADPNTIITDKESNMNHGDHNSGWHLVKYPSIEVMTRGQYGVGLCFDTITRNILYPG